MAETQTIDITDKVSFVNVLDPNRQTVYPNLTKSIDVLAGIAIVLKDERLCAYLPEYFTSKQSTGEENIRIGVSNFAGVYEPQTLEPKEYQTAKQLVEDVVAKLEQYKPRDQ